MPVAPGPFRQAARVDPADASVLRDQRVFYDARAPDYDDAGSFVEMAEVIDAFDRVPVRGDILELAAGTGVWTERLVTRADSLTVLDASEAMLAANRKRLGVSAAAVEYQIVDLFDWRPQRQWDACVFGFWLCKVPDVRLAAFLAAVADALRPGGLVCCIDKTAVTEPATELVERGVRDGRRFTIVDHPRPPERVIQAFAAAGLSVEVETFGDRWCVAQGQRN
jgi:SAM-dependent methyltransferase